MIATRTPRTVSGRHPSRLALLLLGSVFGALLLVSAVGLAGFVWPEDERPSTSLGAIGDFETGVPVSFWVHGGGVSLEPFPNWDFRGYLVVFDGIPLALEARDPLEGCSLVWVAGDDRFSDPCHKNDYWLDGRSVDSPRGASLRQFVLTISSSGEILVDVDGGPR